MEVSNPSRPSSTTEAEKFVAGDKRDNAAIPAPFAFAVDAVKAVFILPLQAHFDVLQWLCLHDDHV
jgi:hypothetical protein